MLNIIIIINNLKSKVQMLNMWMIGTLTAN